MILDRFMLDSRIAKGDGELEPEVRAALVDAAEQFVLAGGHVTWDLWREFSPDSRAAFLRARRRIWLVELSELASVLSGGSDAIAELYRPLDDGDALVRLALERATAAAEARVTAARPKEGS